MRKATGALLLFIAALIPFTCWADNARDSTVNPGNAEHLGVIDSAQEDTADDINANDGEEYTALGGVLNTAYSSCCCSCGDCGNAPCETCRPKCGTLEFFGPIAVINQHPPNVIFLSPVPETATVLADGESYLRLKLDFSNHVIRELDSGVLAEYDFEVERLTAEYHLGMGAGEFSARLPLISRNHGFLDEVISSWHQLYGMPNATRLEWPSNLYRFTIITREGPVFNDEGDVLAIGDLALTYKLPIYNHGDGRDALSIRGGVKAPTGDPGHATGSGNWDTMLGVLYQRQFGGRWRAYANLDWVFVGRPDWDNIAWQDTPATMWGVEYAWKPGTTLLAQYSTRRNALRIGSYEADKDSQDLVLGFNHRLGEHTVLSGGIMEDFNPETSVDFLVMAHLKIDL